MPDDAEITAMAAMAKLIEPFGLPERRRMIEWVRAWSMDLEAGARSLRSKPAVPPAPPEPTPED